MQWLKIIVAVSNVLLLLVGGGVWLAGAWAKNPARKSFGSTLLTVWLGYDLVTLILAWSLGWFA